MRAVSSGRALSLAADVRRFGDASDLAAISTALAEQWADSQGASTLVPYVGDKVVEWDVTNNTLATVVSLFDFISPLSAAYSRALTSTPTR
jgi:hypothetical protein